MAGDAVADPVGLDQHDPRAGLVQQQRGGHADDAAADHRDVRRDVLVQAREGGAAVASSQIEPFMPALPAQRQLLEPHQRLRVAQPRRRRCTSGLYFSGVQTVGVLDHRARACRRRPAQPSSTDAVPNGRPFARSCSRRGGSASSTSV